MYVQYVLCTYKIITYVRIHTYIHTYVSGCLIAFVRMEELQKEFTHKKHIVFAEHIEKFEK